MIFALPCKVWKQAHLSAGTTAASAYSQPELGFFIASIKEIIFDCYCNLQEPQSARAMMPGKMPQIGGQMRIWAKTEDFSEGKYLVVRRDGTIPAWPDFLLGGDDRSTPAALRAYADDAEQRALDP
jgi:hypothetical protein